MYKMILAIVLSTFTLGASAADASCTAQAGEKKLAEAAKNSFMKKCEGDATAACEKAVDAKKLAGAAKTSFT